MCFPLKILLVGQDKGINEMVVKQLEHEPEFQLTEVNNIHVRTDFRALNIEPQVCIIAYSSLQEANWLITWIQQYRNKIPLLSFGAPLPDKDLFHLYNIGTNGHLSYLDSTLLPKNLRDMHQYGHQINADVFRLLRQSKFDSNKEDQGLLEKMNGLQPIQKEIVLLIKNESEITNDEIAERLNLSKSTNYRHLDIIYKYFGVDNKRDLLKVVK